MGATGVTAVGAMSEERKAGSGHTGRRIRLMAVTTFAALCGVALAILVLKGSDWAMPGKGIAWSLLAGTSGAIGAFCVLLAFGAKGQPAVVMSIIFAGAPIVNAVVALSIHPPAGGFSSLRWQFVVGILMAAVGGTMVTLYKPGPAPPPPGVHR